MAKPVAIVKADDFGEPDDFNGEEMVEGQAPVSGNDDHHNNVPSSDGGSLSLEDLNNLSFEGRSDAEDYATINPPAGRWVKKDRWKVAKRVYLEDQMKGDVDPSGRTFFTISGKPESRQANGQDYEPVLFLRISPDKRYKRDDPTKYDMAFKLFLKVKEKVYFDVHSRTPKTLGEVIGMLEEDEYTLQTMAGDNGLVITDISVPRMQR